MHRDLLLAWRNAIRRPGFTLLVVLTLALGIGVNSAVFALLDGVLLRPLPYRDPSRIVFLWLTLPQQNITELEATPWDYDGWHSLHSVSELGMAISDTFTLTGGDADPERVRGTRMTASMLPLLGIAPRLGRAFTPDEDLDTTAPVAILSDGLWRRRFGADPNAVGRIVQINGESRTIVGVMPRGVSLPGPLAGDDDVWLPARLSASERASQSFHNYRVLGRVAPGFTVAQASAEFDAFAKRMAEQPARRSMGARLIPLTEETTSRIKPTLLLIAGSVALLLLVASANASTLLLARASNRRHELAVRTALGATQGHLLWLSIAESLVFAFLGGVAGLLLGTWALRGILPLFAGALPPAIPIDVDARVALFTAGVSAILGLLFGVVAAVHRPGGRFADVLKASARPIAESGARARGALVIAQVALAVILLSAAGLMLNSVVKLSRVRPGFDADHLLTFKVALTGSNYSAAPTRIGLASEIVARLGQTPALRSAALGSVIPFGGARQGSLFVIEGRPIKSGELLIADQRYVSPSYFPTMNIPLLEGRTFTATDDARAEPVVIINRTMANRYWPDENPIDRRVCIGARFDSGSWFRIVGVVDDVRHISLSRDPVVEMYRPIAQTGTPMFTLVVRTVGEPTAFAPTARAAVQAMDPNLPIYDVRTMEDRIAGSVAPTRRTSPLLLVAAAL